jgi:hypothetical protein
MTFKMPTKNIYFYEYGIFAFGDTCTSFFKDKKSKGFFYCFCLMMEESESGSGSRYRTGYVPNNYGSGSERPKHIQILRLHDTGAI